MASTTTNNDNMKKKTKEGLLVTELGKIEPLYNEFDGKMYAGSLPSDHDDRRGEMMFWLFEPTTQAVPDTMVIWLNGGPGCSSWNCGVMMEHSPVTQPLRPAGYCCLSSQPELGVNEYAWTKSTTMLYPEQPIGTGFSYGTYPKDEQDVAADLWQFMQNFYEVFDHLKTYKLFVMGESYAGMYLPSVGRFFHLQNERIKSGRFPEETASWTYIPLGGVGIGNGWMNGFIQGPAVIDYSWWHGLIDEPTRNALHNVFQACMDQWRGRGKELPAPFHSFNVQDDCGMMWGVLEAAGNPNAYDVTTWDPNVDQVTFTSEAFYNRIDVRKALHAPLNITWHGCADGNGRRRSLQGIRGGAMGDSLFHRKLYMENDRPIDVVPYVADLLDADIPVLVYNGDRDMTTGGTGSELLLNGMDWKGKEEWLDADRGVWMVEDKKGGEGGWAKEYLSLKFVIVYNSGHMVPYNQPVAAMDLLNRFLRNETFLDVPSPTIRFGDTSVASAYEMANPKKAPEETPFPIPVIVLLAFLAGVVFTILGAKLWYSRRGAKEGYTRIPENIINGNGKSGYHFETSTE
mmetsp:Transcript_13826/g.22234  ORF Transcript_13826/g.22234 Transcript_13826/m.22234 type:complete len:571 (+) Transcript_13826:106-1818(+)